MNENLTIVKCYGIEMLAPISALADEIWKEYYPSILSKEQIEYMVTSFQSVKAMDEQVRHQHYAYYQILMNDELIGYMGLQFQPDRLFLSKLYLKKEVRAKGIAQKALAFAFEQGRKQCYSSMFLTVNKQNTLALHVYKKNGFEVIEEEMTDIGQDYVMDDYVLECVL